jgi:two-component SAPR family response regulator
MSTPADILIIDDDKDLVNSIEIILQTAKKAMAKSKKRSRTLFFWM